MDRFRRGWRLITACAKLARGNRSLLVLPIVSAAALMISMGLIFGSAYACFGSESAAHRAIHVHPVIFVLSAATLSLPFSLVVTFCNSALVGCMLRQMEGKPHVWRDGMRMAWAKRGAIIGWTLFCALGLFLLVPLGRTLRRLPLLGPVVSKLFLIVMGVSWALITFLVIPVIIFEEQPNLWARLRRSEELFKRTWGEQIVGRGSVILFLYLAAAIILAPLFLAKHFGMTHLTEQAIVFGFILLINPILCAAGTAMQSIFSAACYSYAVTGMLPEEFGADLLPQRKA